MSKQPRSQKQRGAAMIQFCFASLLLVPMFLGTWTFGYTFYIYSRLENAVRNGARYASLQIYDSSTATPSTAFQQAVQYMTVYGDPTADPATATPVVPNLSTSNVQLTVTFNNSAPSVMTVSITGYKVQTFNGMVTLSGKPYISFPFLGFWGPPAT